MTGSIERSAERDAAIRAILPHVPARGWTWAALRAG
ncbi:MAG: COQ9 family protein, partial [Acetobacteraceae bacterium]|nr:COQ9 family protein [Acetobacteraceae bacterium]